MQTDTMDRAAVALGAVPFPRDAIVTDREAAEILKVSRSWLKTLRVRGGGPTFSRMGPQVIRYKVGDLLAWADSKRVTSTSVA